MDTIKRLLIAGAAMFAGHAAHATTLLSLPINTPINTTKTTPIQAEDWTPENLTVQCNFVYGSGGETVDAYVQISVDGGTTWVDVAECHFTTASLRELYDISSLPSVVSSRIASTPNGGMISWRVQYVSTGTYADGTTLKIDLIPVAPGRSHDARPNSTPDLRLRHGWITPSGTEFARDDVSLSQFHHNKLTQ